MSRISSISSVSGSGFDGRAEAVVVRGCGQAEVRTGAALPGLAAACGHDTLPVRPRPRVRALVTGDELTHTGHPAPGQVRDALGPMPPSLAHTLGGEVTGPHHVPDRPTSSLADALRRAPYGSDVIVVTGSTSAGVTDQLCAFLAGDGDARWIVDTVACRPGHPQLLAQLPDGRWILGLPGNPYAAVVAAHTLLAPLLAGLTGRPMPALSRVALTGDIRTAPGRTRLVLVTWDGVTGRAVGGHGSAFLRGAALADALAAGLAAPRPGSPDTAHGMRCARHRAIALTRTGGHNPLAGAGARYVRSAP
ncbi:molybdopterin-binding protein [Streptomyces sp. NPDC050528]|uniref:molybdopterin-binding protein n=1 Tax=Streptomyces sp. NPDC050528 TaxID=3365623 RepID=UPI0037BC52E6